jgi:DNA-binding MarR family transcriptional regulator
MGVVGRIFRLAQLLQAELEPIFAAHGVNGGAFDVLAALRRAGRPYRLTPTALSKALMVTSGGMTKRLTARSFSIRNQLSMKAWLSGSR